MRTRTFWASLVVIALLSVVRIVSTYRVFSQTIDEPIHLAAGFRWLAFGNLIVDIEHPPLARVAVAIVPYLQGARISGDDDKHKQGNSILYRDDRYRHNLAVVRAGILPFFLLGLFAVALWARLLFGNAVAIVSAAVFASLPPILGHAGLATTDMAVAAATAAALYAFVLWLREPAGSRAALLGLTAGIGLVSKFSFPVFFVAGAIALAAPRILRRQIARISVRAMQLIGAAAIAVLIVWASYRFTTGTLLHTRPFLFPEDYAAYDAARYELSPGYEWVRADIVQRYRDYEHELERRGKPGVDFVDWARAAGYPSPAAGRHGDTMRGAPPLPRLPLSDRLLEPFRAGWQWIAAHVPLPAPVFFVGWERVVYHASGGHAAYLFGRTSLIGWWYYFPVVFLFKSPIAFLVFAGAGCVLLIRKRESDAIGLAIAPAAMMVPVLFSSLNIGVRHILPIYAPLAIVAGFAAVSMWTSRESRPAVVVLLLWFFGATLWAHPDYLAYFNEFAGRHPERIALDSNLDWGQDLLRLRDVARRQHIDRLHLAYFGSADLAKTLPQAEVLEPSQRVSGWVAISEMRMEFGDPDWGPGDYRWLERDTPVRRVGKSIRLYRVDVESRAAAAK